MAEAVEDAKGKGGVPEYLCRFDVSIVYVDPGGDCVPESSSGRAPPGVRRGWGGGARVVVVDSLARAREKGSVDGGVPLERTLTPDGADIGKKKCRRLATAGETEKQEKERTVRGGGQLMFN